MPISQVIASGYQSGSDLQLTATGDLQTVSGESYTEQRILRRLFTTPGTYYFHPDYGVGLTRFIGQPLSNELFNETKILIISQMFQEATVAKTPEPVITIQSNAYAIFGDIQYYEAPTNIYKVLSFNFQK